ncbi:hypothetical protein ACFY19_15780 [Streptosporangium saharense]|uniref:hypothetical protein n=1 Tax=Streptosporangium saharense TaxID=1706840 RepID=UPI0036C000EB
MTNSSSVPPTTTDGYINPLPLLIRAGITLESVAYMPSPWGAPAGTAAVGRNEAGVPWLGIASETPFSWLRVSEPVPKQQLEFLHIQRLAVDHRLATNRELYDAVVVPETDPPDFHVLAGGKQAGCELTVLSIQQRRQAQALFFEVAKRLGLQHRHRIGHLTGYHVSMWFGTADDPTGLPFQRTDHDAHDRLVEALVAFQPDPDQLKAPGGELPKQFDARPVRTPDDASFFAVPLVGGVPASGLFGTTGISLGLAFQSDHTAQQEWANLRAIVQRKDRPTNDFLLISVGAPDRQGQCFLSEELLADFMLQHPEELTTNHLSSVILHFWSTGRAFELLGGAPRSLWPPLYNGFAPSHHPIRPKEDQSGHVHA